MPLLEAVSTDDGRTIKRVTPKKTVYASLKRMIKNKDADISMIETGVYTYNNK